VLENGVVVAPSFSSMRSGSGPALDVASRHYGDIKRAAHGYDPTREAAMAAFAKIWRRE
jgi:hypothetical protein